MVENLIIIPTYNERDNIEQLLNVVFKTLKKIPVNILVIDDNSPDETYAIVEKLMKKHRKKLFLVKRKEKSGLGTAYVYGFKWGLSRGYENFIEMDADFSHKPEYLKHMIELSSKYDFIIGSRYVKGGGIEGWGLYRRILSRAGSLYSKTILGCSINDLTGGFNLWKKKVLLGIDVKNIISEGYSFQIEMKYRAFRKGFKFQELPIIFTDRTLGVSKMSKAIILEAAVAVWKFRFGK